MSSLRVTSLRGRTSGVSPTLPDGAVVTGVTTSTSFDGDLTGDVTGNATGLTGTPDVTLGNVNAGVITATSFTGTVDSSNLSGALPALDGSALTNLNIPSSFTELDAALFN